MEVAWTCESPQKWKRPGGFRCCDPREGHQDPRKNEATRGHDGEPPGKIMTVMRLPLSLALFHTRQQSSKWMSPGTMQLQHRCQDASGSPNRNLQLPSRRIDLGLVSVTESRARSATRLQTGVTGGHGARPVAVPSRISGNFEELSSPLADTKRQREILIAW